MFLLRLALKNLTRAKRRSLLSSAAVVVGVFYLIVGQSFIGGLEESIISGVVNGITGHVTLRPAGYPSEGLDHPVDEVLTISPKLRETLDSRSRAWTERTIFAATLTSDAESLRMRVIGYDPKRDPEVFSRVTWKLDGTMPATEADGVFLTSTTAELLEVKVGDFVVIQVRTHEGAMNAMSVKVGAIGRTGNVMFDNGGVFAPVALVRELVRTTGPTHVSLILPNRNDSQDIKKLLVAQGEGAIEGSDWKDDSEAMLAMQRYRRTALSVFVGMLLLMSSMAIANTILMAAHERVREVGTLRAMGLSQQGILKLFLMEGALLGTVAGLIGALCGATVALHFSENPFDLNSLKGSTMGSDVQLSSYIYGSFTPSMVLVPVLISLVVALLASVYPARVASVMEPADAVRAQT